MSYWWCIPNPICCDRLSPSLPTCWYSLLLYASGYLLLAQESLGCIDIYSYSPWGWWLIPFQRKNNSIKETVAKVFWGLQSQLWSTWSRRAKVSSVWIPLVKLSPDSRGKNDKHLNAFISVIPACRIFYYLLYIWHFLFANVSTMQENVHSCWHMLKLCAASSAEQIHFQLVGWLWDTWLSEANNFPEYLIYVCASFLLTVS